MRTLKVLWELFQWVGWAIVVVQNWHRPAVQKFLAWVQEHLRKKGS